MLLAGDGGGSAHSRRCQGLQTQWGGPRQDLEPLCLAAGVLWSCRQQERLSDSRNMLALPVGGGDLTARAAHGSQILRHKTQRRPVQGYRQRH